MGSKNRFIPDGKVICNNGEINKYYNENEIPQGWIKGKLIRNKPIRKSGRKCYTNGVDNKLIFDGDTIPEGYYLGKTVSKTTVKGYKTYTNGVKDIHLYPEDTIPEGFILGSCHHSSKGYKTFKNDEGEVIRCKSDEVPEGFTQCKLKEVYNDGIKNYYLKPNDPRKSELIKGRLQDTLDKISKAEKGKKVSKETKAKLLQTQYNNRKRLYGDKVFDLTHDSNKLRDFIINLPHEKRTCIGVWRELKKLDSNCNMPYTSITSYLGNGIHDLLHKEVISSRYELDLIEYIQTFYQGEIIQGYRPKWLKFDNSNYPKEIDVYLPEFSLGIEVNGDYWHKDLEDKHKLKTDICRDNGIHLIHIYEYELFIDSLKGKILTYIKYLILNKTKLYARKLKLDIINSNLSNKFLNLYHFQGADKSTIHLGLHDSKRLYAVMTFCKSRYDKNFEWELSRYCVNSEYMIIGGAEKLFKGFVNKYNPKSIVSYCDFSKFTGQVYDKLGFVLVNNLAGYKYVNEDHIMLSRYQCQKHILVNKYKDIIKDIESKTEFEIMTELGYIKKSDAGQGKYIYRVG